MWHGYFRIDKGSVISEANITALKAMTVNPGGASHLCGGIATNLDGEEAMVEICYAIEPVEGDLPFGVDTFAIMAGATWEAMAETARQYIITNAVTWLP